MENPSSIFTPVSLTLSVSLTLTRSFRPFGCFVVRVIRNHETFHNIARLWSMVIINMELLQCFYIIDHHSTTYPHTEPQQQQQQTT